MQSLSGYETQTVATKTHLRSGLLETQTSHVDSDQFSCRLENDSVEKIFNEDIDMILLYMMFTVFFANAVYCPVIRTNIL